MHVLVLPARNKKIQSKMKKRESQNIIHWFIRPSKADNSAVSGGIWRTSIYACPCYPQKRRSNKNKHARVATKFLLLFKLIGIFWDAQGQVTRHTTVHDQIWHNFEHIWNFVVVVFNNTCKKEEDPTKNEGARVLTTYFFRCSRAA